MTGKRKRVYTPSQRAAHLEFGRSGPIRFKPIRVQAWKENHPHEDYEVHAVVKGEKATFVVSEMTEESLRLIRSELGLPNKNVRALGATVEEDRVKRKEETLAEATRQIESKEKQGWKVVKIGVAMEALDKIIESNPQKAYDDMKKMYAEGGSKDPELLWRMGKACHSIANDFDRKNPKKKELILEGRGYAQAAASMNDQKFIVLKWAAILTGSATDYVGTKEKIEQGNVFKSFLDKALAMDAKEYSLLHMRGRYAYSVANLSWLERKAAAAFFATPPEATIDEALRDFLAANDVRKGWLENLVYIARCYIAKKDSKNAAIYLQEAVKIEPADDSEKELIEEAKGLLKKHGG